MPFVGKHKLVATEELRSKHRHSGCIRYKAVKYPSPTVKYTYHISGDHREAYIVHIRVDITYTCNKTMSLFFVEGAIRCTLSK